MEAYYIFKSLFEQKSIRIGQSLNQSVSEHPPAAGARGRLLQSAGRNYRIDSSLSICLFGKA